MPTNNRTYMKAYYHRKRKEVITALGGTCIFCGESDISELRIDHRNGYKGAHSPNGSRGGMRNLFDIIKLIKNGKKNELQIVCRSCDQLRGYKN